MLARISAKTRKLLGVVVVAVALVVVAVIVHVVTGADSFVQIAELLSFFAAGFTGVTIVNIWRDLHRLR